MTKSKLSYVFLYLLCMNICSPYDGKWSKTMVGFGPEDHHFVAELTYNYGVGEYRLGNDFLVNHFVLKSCLFFLEMNISPFIFPLLYVLLGFHTAV